MHFGKVIFFFITLFIIVNMQSAHAQKKGEVIRKGDPEKAMMLVKSGNFNSAIKELEILVAEEPENLTYRVFLGFAYLNTTVNKVKAIPHFEMVAKDTKSDPYCHYDLGKAYLLAYRFDDAIKSLEKFRSITHDKENNLSVSAKRMIEMCNQAKEIFKNRVNVRLDNLGPEVNSSSPDYSPFIDENETTLFFTSRRAGNTGNMDDVDGLRTADVFISNLESDKWTKAKRVSSAINTYLIEESVGMSADGNELFIYIFSEKGMDDVFRATKRGRNYQKAEYLTINTPYVETAASITPDKNAIFFASKRPGGKGKSDLWMAFKLPTGAWSEAVNLGDSINTEFDEDFPQIAPDGKTLYFSSTGHYGMGGYDLFKTTWDNKTNKFSKPVNIGYPINTPDDNKTISFSKSGRYAYMHDAREGGYGDLDVYKVTFLDFPAPYATYIGHVFNKDSVEMEEQRLKNIAIAQSNFNKIEKEIETLVLKTTSLQKSIADLEMDTTTQGMAKKNQFSKTLAKSEEVLTMLKNSKLPEAQQAVVEASKPLNIKILLLNQNTHKVMYQFTPSKLSGEFAIIAPPGSYNMIIKSDVFPAINRIFVIPDREPLKDPYVYNVFIK